MKKPLLKSARQGFGLLSIRMRQWICLIAIGLASNGLTAQTPDCNIIMACNDNIQVSLGSDCTELLKPDMILEDPTYPDNFYTVTLWRASGAEVADMTLRQIMIGETLSARVKLNNCDISCWGNLTVEDKLPPVFSTCPSPIEVECEDSIEPNDVGRPFASDACTAIDLEYNDTVEKLKCDQPYTMTITRDWTATDRYGNSSTCQQIINVFRASIDDVTFPGDFAGPTALECGVAIPYLPNGAPSPDFTGYPNGIECPNINYYFDDLIFDLCGGGIKVLRQWNVLDWCTGRDTVGNQIIKVLDTSPPVCISSNDFDFDISTDEWNCTGTFDVPAPVIAFECSGYDYIVGYKLRDENGDPFDEPVYDNVTKITNPDGSYFYRITDLPQDTSWIVYTITDECGLSTQCFAEVIVKDNEKPSAICEGYSVVTLGTDGWADVDALSIDDNSIDNCELVDYHVKRLVDNCGYPQDLNFSDKVNFCCSDVSTDPNFYIKVVLRVTDASGNFNDCVANVKVQDKIDPTITCPPTYTAQCDGDTSPSVTGMATGTDNCDVNITFSDVNNQNDCGIGTISRRFTATDPGGRTRSCTQKINVIDSNPFNINNVTFPRDITINGCTVADADPLITGSLPTYTNDNCADIAVSYDDVIFEIQGACALIQRSWRLVDWCNYSPSNPNYITGKQKITLMNNTPPQFTSTCTNRTIESQDNDCEEYVEHRAEAQDDCTPSSQIVYRWEYDENNNGSIDKSGNGAFTADVYPAGLHRFTFYAVDLCDNEAKCTYTFRITDGKAPTPICHREIVWVLDDKGEAEVWAEDFNLKSFDLCDNDENLRFSFDNTTGRPVMDFDCSDVPNGIAQEIELRMYVFDSDGNSEYCEVILILQDSPNNDACVDDPNAMGRIAGNVNHHTNVGLNDVDVQLIDDMTKEAVIEFTNDEGHFEFDEALFYGMYSIAPYSDNDILNGVSTLDLVLIQRHILGIDELDQPTSIIAADINADNRVTAADLVALRKVILGVTNKYQNNNSWRFVPTNYEFLVPDDPFGFPEMITIDSMMLDHMNSDFESIKIGDVNNSSQANIRNVESENRSAGLQLVIDNKEVNSGTLIEVPVYAGSNMLMTGLQLDLIFDQYNLDFVGVESGLLSLRDGDFNKEGNSFKLSYAGMNATQVNDGDLLFTLNLMAKVDTDLSSIELNDAGMISESYDHTFSEGNVNLDLRNDQFTAVFENVIASPNPFFEKTVLEINLSEANPLNINVYDVAGKNVYSSLESGYKGNNKISIHSNQLGDKPGVYLFKVDTGTTVYSGKIILTK